MGAPTTMLGRQHPAQRASPGFPVAVQPFCIQKGGEVEPRPPSIRGGAGRAAPWTPGSSPPRRAPCSPCNACAVAAPAPPLPARPRPPAPDAGRSRRARVSPSRGGGAVSVDTRPLSARGMRAEAAEAAPPRAPPPAARPGPPFPLQPCTCQVHHWKGRFGVPDSPEGRRARHDTAGLTNPPDPLGAGPPLPPPPPPGVRAGGLQRDVELRCAAAASSPLQREGLGG